MVNVTNNIRKYIFPFAVVCMLLLLMGGCKKNGTYTIIFDANGGTGTMEPQIVKYGEQFTLKKNVFTRENYVFVNWNSIPDGSGLAIDDEQTYIASSNSELTLYAQWERNTAIVTFNANGGTGEMTPQTFTIGVAQALSTNSFTRENCIFLGWNTVQDGSGATYSEMQEITIEENITLYAQWMIPTGQQGGHYYVDLGLPSGTLWATCNVGAVNPTDYGDYFAWGETEPKDCYNWSTYKFYDQTGCYKYDIEQQELEVEDDAAAVNWGSSWRMPSGSKIDELCRYTTHTWTNINGINGMLITGTNGNSIFLPAAGERKNTLSWDGICYYWANQVRISMDFDSNDAWYLEAQSTGEIHQNCYMYRYIGLPVRPIIENN